TACRRAYKARDEEMAALGLVDGERPTLFRAQGCAECGDLGYKGRTGIFELLVIGEAIRDLILQRRPVTAIMASAQAAGMQTLQASARQKVLDGVTSVQEWQRLMLTELG
ncbi:MAG: type II secretion system protein GspE, partial [Candidatus Rokuibacteriota bacterium]